MKKISIIVIVLLSLLFIAGCAQGNQDEPGIIRGDVFLDCNQDGECDCEESGFANVSIQIFNDQCAGVPLQTIDTNEDGTFEFTDLEPGPYCVMSNLKPNCGGHFPTTTITQQVVLEPGQALQLESFGYTEAGQ